MDTPIPVTIDLDIDIKRLPKVGEDPTQYFRGWDNDKKLSQQFKERFGLHRNGRTYRIDNINE